MRKTLALAAAAAAAVAVTIPAQPANAACQYPLSIACGAICIVTDVLERPCPR